MWLVFTRLDKREGRQKWSKEQKLDELTDEEKIIIDLIAKRLTEYKSKLNDQT